MSLLQEGPRKPRLVPKWHRLRAVDIATRDQLRDFQLGITDYTLEIGEPVSAGQPLIFESVDVFTAPSPVQETPRIVRAGDIAKKRAIVVEDLLSNPNAPATREWRAFIQRNFERIRNFAKTARNKGENLDPEFLK